MTNTDTTTTKTTNEDGTVTTVYTSEKFEIVQVSGPETIVGITTCFSTGERWVTTNNIVTGTSSHVDLPPVQPTA